jgi:hypothetical protein
MDRRKRKKYGRGDWPRLFFLFVRRKMNRKKAPLAGFARPGWVHIAVGGK